MISSVAENPPVRATFPPVENPAIEAPIVPVRTVGPALLCPPPLLIEWAVISALFPKAVAAPARSAAVKRKVFVFIERFFSGPRFSRRRAVIRSGRGVPRAYRVRKRVRLDRRVGSGVRQFSNGGRGFPF